MPCFDSPTLDSLTSEKGRPALDSLTGDAGRPAPDRRALDSLTGDATLATLDSPTRRAVPSLISTNPARQTQSLTCADKLCFRVSLARDVQKAG